MAGAAPTSGEYITHHLQNLSVSIGDGEFWTLNVDTLIMSTLVALVGFGVLFWISRRVTTGTPGRLQAGLEYLIEMVDDQVKQVIPGHDRTIVGPLALTIFFWVLTMNTMDFLPVDLPSTVLGWFGVDHFKAVPTADLSTTFGISLSVMLSIIFFSVKVKGVGGYIHELVSAPFGSHVLLWIPNFLMNLIELLSKPLSLGMRLFCNMYAGELVFLLIALLGGAATLSLTGGILLVTQVILDTCWAIFHILIILLQAYIFMMLSVIYVGLAHETH